MASERPPSGEPPSSPRSSAAPEKSPDTADPDCTAGRAASPRNHDCHPLRLHQLPKEIFDEITDYLTEKEKLILRSVSVATEKMLFDWFLGFFKRRLDWRGGAVTVRITHDDLLQFKAFITNLPTIAQLIRQINVNVTSYGDPQPLEEAARLCGCCDKLYLDHLDYDQRGIAKLLANEPFPIKPSEQPYHSIHPHVRYQALQYEHEWMTATKYDERVLTDALSRLTQLEGLRIANWTEDSHQILYSYEHSSIVRATIRDIQSTSWMVCPSLKVNGAEVAEVGIRNMSHATTIFLTALGKSGCTLQNLILGIISGSCASTRCSVGMWALNGFRNAPYLETLRNLELTLNDGRLSDQLAEREFAMGDSAVSRFVLAAKNLESLALVGCGFAGMAIMSEFFTASVLQSCSPNLQWIRLYGLVAAFDDLNGFFTQRRGRLIGASIARIVLLGATAGTLMETLRNIVKPRGVRIGTIYSIPNTGAAETDSLLLEESFQT